jgi:hypothetical protein
MIVTTGETIKKLVVFCFLCSETSNLLEGLNKISLPISTDKFNGFHLIPIDNIARPDLLSKKTYIYDAIIPDDAIVLTNKTYTDFYTNCVNLTNKRIIWKDRKACSIIFSNKECYSYFPFVDESIQTYSMAKMAIDYCPAAYFAVKKSLLNEELRILTIQKSPSMIMQFDKESITDNICRMAITNRPSLLKEIIPELKTTELCMLAIQREKSKPFNNLEEIFTMINHDEKTYSKCCNLTSNPLKYFEIAFKSMDKTKQTPSFVEFIVNNSPLLIKYVRTDLKTESLCMIACEKKWRAYKFIKPEFKSTLQFMKYRILRHFEKK